MRNIIVGLCALLLFGVASAQVDVVGGYRKSAASALSAPAGAPDPVAIEEAFSSKGAAFFRRHAGKKFTIRSIPLSFVGPVKTASGDSFNAIDVSLGVLDNGAAFCVDVKSSDGGRYRTGHCVDAVGAGNFSSVALNFPSFNPFPPGYAVRHPPSVPGGYAACSDCYQYDFGSGLSSVALGSFDVPFLSFIDNYSKSFEPGRVIFSVKRDSPDRGICREVYVGINLIPTPAGLVPSVLIKGHVGSLSYGYCGVGSTTILYSGDWSGNYFPDADLWF